MKPSVPWLGSKPAQQFYAIWTTAHFLCLFHLENLLLPEISPPALKTSTLYCLSCTSDSIPNAQLMGGFEHLSFLSFEIPLQILNQALNIQRRCCLQTIPFEFYLAPTACWERGCEAFTRALWLPRQCRSIKLVDTHLIILSLAQEAPSYPGHQRIPLSRSIWERRGHLPTLSV